MLLEIFLTDRFKYHIVKQIFSGGDQTFVLCSKYESKLELWQIRTLSMWHVVSPTVWPSVTGASCFLGVQGVMVS